MTMIIPGSLIAYGDRLFAKVKMFKYVKGESIVFAKVINSKDGGKTWKFLKYPVSPLAVLKDERFNRLLCFTANDTYQMCSGSRRWSILPHSWRSALPHTVVIDPSYPININPVIFASGVILLQVQHSNSDFDHFLSRPRFDACVEDKLMLAMTLARFGIPSAVFTNFIGQFIFPF